LRRQMGCGRDGNDAVETLALTDVISNADRSRGLNDTKINAGEAATELGQKTAHAPFSQASVFGTVSAIDGVCEVIRWRLVAPRRRRSIGYAVASGQLVLTDHGVLHESPLVFAQLGLPLLRFRRQWRDLPVGRINDHTGTFAGRPL